ncbi:transcriptional regulator [Leptolyngbya sp. Heron Island J]|uniref:TetR/AcrR family transcriptional regulator n=1 Tax=Leptolyngbya sp. Heron Island J TaxID=1385935 RepID=UPI0003B99F75|nr:TetR/AcrR family transcriptional regulator [Leptolyngbya sp. Heron Island J]ESA39110.1 transcriptional regulator [Leptolyngbya sp. Heron Island J]
MGNNTVIQKNGVTNYQTAQSQHQQALRRGILDDASSLLIREGPTALSMRRIAQLVGCSTTVLYTMFGNKQGLVDQLYLRGFEKLCQALQAVSCTGSSHDYIYALGRAYYQFALDNSTYYAIMFSNPIAEYVPSETSQQLGQESLKLLVQALQDCAPIDEDEAWNQARIIWATIHGHVTLELAGYFDYPYVVPQQTLERALKALISQLLPVKSE